MTLFWSRPDDPNTPGQMVAKTSFGEVDMLIVRHSTHSYRVFVHLEFDRPGEPLIAFRGRHAKDRLHAWLDKIASDLKAGRGLRSRALKPLRDLVAARTAQGWLDAAGGAL